MAQFDFSRCIVAATTHAEMNLSSFYIQFIHYFNSFSNKFNNKMALHGNCSKQQKKKNRKFSTVFRAWNFPSCSLAVLGVTRMVGEDIPQSWERVSEVIQVHEVASGCNHAQQHVVFATTIHIAVGAQKMVCEIEIAFRPNDKWVSGALLRELVNGQTNKVSDFFNLVRGKTEKNTTRTEIKQNWKTQTKA